MSVRIDNDRIRLMGNCPVEDAETLLQALQKRDGPIDLHEAGWLHTAVMQVLLAADAEMIGEPAEVFVRLHLMPILMGRTD